MKSIKEIKKSYLIDQVSSGFNLNYNFNVSNDLNKILKNEATISYDDEKHKIVSTYYELHDIGNTQYISADLQKSFKNNLNFLIGAKKNPVCTGFFFNKI